VDNPEGAKFGDYVFMNDKTVVASSLEKLAEFMGLMNMHQELPRRG
jgi:hypothetical protein